MTARMLWLRQTCSMIVFFPFMRNTMYGCSAFSPIGARNTVAIENRTSTSCIWQWRTSTTPAPVPSRRRPTASANASIAPRRKNSTAWHFAKKLYTTLEELQLDLDTWLREYNQEREHSGKYCFGKTPMQTFMDSRHLAREKMLDRLTVGDASDTAGLRAAPERSPQERSAGTARLTGRITMAAVRPSLG
jgi:hypothetical protein